MNETLPDDVLSAKSELQQQPDHELHEIAKRLTAKGPDCLKMWRSWERIARAHDPLSDDNLWVYSFLYRAHSASTLPPYHGLSVVAREKLSKRIAKFADGLCDELEKNELDGHLVPFEYWGIQDLAMYEDCGALDRAKLDRDGVQKFRATDVINAIADRAIYKIEQEPIKGKSGKNAAAIRFVRTLTAQVRAVYGSAPLLATATATNMLYQTNYEESDISKLLLR